MARVIPNSFYKDNNIPKKEEKPKRKSSQEVAIERAKQRNALLDSFCNKYKIDTNHEMCKIIRKSFRNPASKNIPIGEYKKELDMIGKSMLEGNTIENIVNILQSNCNKGYKYLIYENQLKLKNKKSTSKDNISVESRKNTKQVTLDDFDDYRQYLTNPNSNSELLEFVRNKLGVNVDVSV